MIDTAVAMTVKLKPTQFGLIGGRRTVVSGVYRRGFADVGLRSSQRIAQPLSGLIESGDIGSDKLRDEAKRILSPISNSSHILLACTHYPAIEPVMREFVSGSSIFLDPAAELVSKVGKWAIPVGSVSEFLTTGDPKRMCIAASKAFGVNIEKADNTKI